MKVISMMLAGEEIARIEEGKFTYVIEPKGGSLAPNFVNWYNDCFYGIPHSSTFEERFKLVEENNYFCFSKPKLKLIAKEID